MSSVIRDNERSWAITLIGKINRFLDGADLRIKRAGGERTLAFNGASMFPDLVLYADDEQSVALQGWELKMPDVPIENEAFVNDATRKANALSLNSFLLWNFTYATLYIREEGESFRIAKQWTDSQHIKTRDDVRYYRADWEKLLERVILEVNQYFIRGKFRESRLGEALATNAVSSIIQRNKGLIAEELSQRSVADAVQEAFIGNWWDNVNIEYQYDETNKYYAYAKSIILNWANRILFAHLIKERQNGAFLIDSVSYDVTPSEANDIFKKITQRCDFFNVFSSLPYDEVLPQASWYDFVEFSLFLKENGIKSLGRSVLCNILEKTVASTKREFHGQYVTPKELARILTRITICNWNEDVLDCCCGTGTIPREALRFKKEKMKTEKAVESVWACDKYQFPLQIANISLVDADSIYLPNRLFQHNALSLKVGETIPIVDPKNGKTTTLRLPEFGAIITNLPFVPSDKISREDKALSLFVPVLDKRADLYCHIILSLSQNLKTNGRLGVITSNSWLGTESGLRFMDVLKDKYVLRQVHISGKGRWFQNADVVATILILQKKQETHSNSVKFFLWKKSLKELENDEYYERTLVNSSLLEKELDSDVLRIASYPNSKINDLLSMNVSYNSLFHNVDWVPNIREKVIRIDSVFEVFRGSRRGWDPLFYPKKGEHKIESQFLQRVLLSARSVETLETKASNDAFCCGLSIEELKEMKYQGALAWINKFEGQVNGCGKPLCEVLKRAKLKWYELERSEIAEFFTGMNPERRLFFSRFDKPSFINQRLIGFRHKPGFEDVELNHALLNSILTLFWTEASGFGRALGALDVSKERIARCFMPNPTLINSRDRNRILSSFQLLKSRKIKNVADELLEEDRLEFERFVLESLGLESFFTQIKDSLLSLQNTRLTAKERT